MAIPSSGATTNGKTARPPRPPGAETVNRRQLLAALRALRRGDFDVRLPDDLGGIDGQVCEAFNDVVTLIAGIGDEVSDLREAVGREGRTKKRLRRGESRGGWSRYVGSVNAMLDDLTAHTDEIARVVQAVSRGDLSQALDVDGTDEPLRGDFLKHGKAVNEMVAQLARFGSEVTRVAREVGVQGKLGAQAEVPGVSGVWKELTDSVNLMASN